MNIQNFLGGIATHVATACPKLDVQICTSEDRNRPLLNEYGSVTICYIGSAFEEPRALGSRIYRQTLDLAIQFRLRDFTDDVNTVPPILGATRLALISAHIEDCIEFSVAGDRFAGAYGDVVQWDLICTAVLLTTPNTKDVKWPTLASVALHDVPQGATRTEITQ